jgi:hypothetical protein
MSVKKMVRKAGKRNIRIKRAIVAILSEHPDGLDSRQIGEKLSAEHGHGIAKARPTGVQLGQLLRATHGVESVGTTQVSVGGDYFVDYTLWKLTDLEKWNRWANR